MYRKNDFAEASKNLEIKYRSLKIILLDYRNNYREHSSW